MYLWSKNVCALLGASLDTTGEQGQNILLKKATVSWLI